MNKIKFKTRQNLYNREIDSESGLCDVTKDQIDRKFEVGDANNIEKLQDKLCTEKQTKKFCDQSGKTLLLKIQICINCFSELNFLFQLDPFIRPSNTTILGLCWARKTFY